MTLPDFNTFLTSEAMAALAERMGQLELETLLQAPSAPDAAAAQALSEAMQRAVTASVEISTLYLRAYHEWLQKELESA